MVSQNSLLFHPRDSSNKDRTSDFFGASASGLVLSGFSPVKDTLDRYISSLCFKHASTRASDKYYSHRYGPAIPKCPNIGYACT